MADLYKTIYTLCESKNISVGKMCTSIGISRGVMTELKKGRSKSLSSSNLEKIAGFFDTSIDYLLEKTDIKKAPEQMGGISDEELQRLAEEIDEDDGSGIILRAKGKSQKSFKIPAEKLALIEMLAKELEENGDSRK